MRTQIIAAFIELQNNIKMQYQYRMFQVNINNHHQHQHRHHCEKQHRIGMESYFQFTGRKSKIWEQKRNQKCLTSKQV